MVLGRKGAESLDIQYGECTVQERKQSKIPDTSDTRKLTMKAKDRRKRRTKTRARRGVLAQRYTG